MAATHRPIKLVKPSPDARRTVKKMPAKRTFRRQTQRAWDEFRTFTTIATWATITGFLIFSGHVIILVLIAAVIVAVLANRSK